MFSTFLQELRGFLGKGYLLSVFVPTLIFWSVNAALGAELVGSISVVWQQWSDLSVEAKLLLSFAGLTSIALFAYAVHNLQLPITRFFEGYWNGTPLSTLQEQRRTFYRDEWRHLKQQVEALDSEVKALKSVIENRETRDAIKADAISKRAEAEAQLSRLLERWITFYSPTLRGSFLIQPTRLGNVLRASELYAWDHYGIEASVLWTRLRPLLESTTVDILEDKKIAMDFMLLMALYTGLLTLIWCPILAFFTDRWKLFLCCAAGVPLSYVFYRNAIQNALAYGELVRAVFDLYRDKLVDALGYKAPTVYADERKFWGDLSLFFQRNVPPTEVVQPAIKAAESYRYLIPPPAPTGWRRIRGAFREIRLGLDEILHKPRKSGET